MPPRATPAERATQQAEGRRLKALRCARDLSQEAMGKAAKVTLHAYQKYETGESRMRNNTVALLAEYLVVRFDQIRKR